MAYSNILVGAGTHPAQPAIRKIGLADLQDALAKGADDFYAMPTHAMFLCIIYPIVGFALARLAFGYSILPLLYPLASGFALVGPIAALGLYELSRRREAGLEPSATRAFDVFEIIFDRCNRGARCAASDNFRYLGRSCQRHLCRELWLCVAIFG